MANERRKQYLVEKKEQFKFIGIVVASFAALAVFMLLSFNSLLVTLLPSGLLAASKGRIFLFVAGALTIVIITAGVILWETHRLFGPISRMERELTSMAEKEDYHLLHVRSKDYLYGLVERMNAIISKLMNK